MGGGGGSLTDCHGRSPAPGSCSAPSTTCPAGGSLLGLGLRASLPQPSHLPRVLSSGLSRATPGAGCARCSRTRGGKLGLLRGHGRLVGEGPSIGSRGRAWSPCLAKALACRLRPASPLLPRPRRRTWPGKSRLGKAQTQANCSPTPPWLLSWMCPCMRQTPLAVPLSLTNGTQTCPLE